MTSFALNENWDLFTDIYGNIVTVSGDEELRQKVKCQLLHVYGESYIQDSGGVMWNARFETPEDAINMIRDVAASVDNVANVTVKLDLDRITRKAKVYVTFTSILSGNELSFTITGSKGGGVPTPPKPPQEINPELALIEPIIESHSEIFPVVKNNGRPNS